ncbi:MAG: YkgJ family cysteine cluster protein [Methanomicrobiales archaeon]|nr:YkgJ family cysteine cluster protein [Methanomicrobiales archaeon]
MTSAEEIPLPYRIIALMQERNRLFTYPLEQIASDIWSARFRCTCCGACCTRSVNNHIFLLDRDVDTLKKIDPAAYVPAPDPEFCDQYGMVYVSGYALRMKNDKAGSCWFLDGCRCRIYDRRFSACRIYPHMLRRSAGVPGHITWKQFARKGRHGERNPELTYDDCLILAREIKEYENAYLTHQIAFHEVIHEFFTVNNLHHDQKMYRKRMQHYERGHRLEMKVYYDGRLEDCMSEKPENGSKPASALPFAGTDRE